MNMGQVLETAAAKIAHKTGQTYIVNNFEHGVDALDKVKKELKAHGLSDTEVLHDPMSGQELGPALVGMQHILKLNFQIDKKVSTRSGMPLDGAEAEHYDADTLIPSGGGKTGGQSMGNLGMYSMLAHGATANIREMQTWKSEGADRKERWDSPHHEIWNAIQNGDIPPPPKKTFAFQKFEDTLRAAGIDVQKKGHQMLLTPLTNQQVLKMSKGELPEPGYVTFAKPDANGEPTTRKGGLFDPVLTGGHGGKNWTHIALPEPVPNPVFENAIQRITGLTKKEYTDVTTGEKAISKDTGKIVPLGTKNAIAGGAGIAHILGQMDVKEELAKAQKSLDSYNIPDNIAHREGTQEIDKRSKKVRYLTALDNAGIHPKDAYVLTNLPVIPPLMRPSSFLPSGDVNHADVNQLYAAIGDISGAMKDKNYKFLSDHDKKIDRANMYDGVKALMGVGENWGDRGKQPKGLLLQIAGSSPKEGFFQSTLLSRRQDMTMRGTITPEPGLGLDSVGLPEKKALDLFRPFVVKKLIDMGAANTPREAHTLLAEPGKKDPMVYKALDHVMAERPVLLKRDPSLHKHSVQAFWSQRVGGKAIQIHPLVTGGFGADFDGDSMAVYVPIGKEAVEEAKKMLPSANIYNEASGKVMYQPTLESSLGLFKLSRVTGDGKQKFDSHADLLKAAQTGALKVTDKAEVNGKATTAGRIMLAAALPDAFHTDIMHNLDMRLNKKGVDKLYTTVAKEHTHDFADVSSRLMRLGYDASFGAIKIQNPNTAGTAGAVEKEGENPKGHVQFLAMGTHSLSLADFTPDKATRDPIVAATQTQVNSINARRDIGDKEKEHHVKEAWFDATEKMVKEHDAKMEKQPNNLFLMQQAGVKPSPDQYRQLRLAPMLMVDSLNKVIAKPVTKSYSEGLDVGSYWSQMSGARRGSVLKVQEVQEPGYFTKQLMNTTMGIQVTTPDCGTSQGLHIPVHSQDIFDRTLAQDHTFGGVTYAKDSIITPQVASAIKSADKNATLLVRSTMKCEHGNGVCQKCAGLSPTGQHYDIGTNVGVLATQALGERATQLTLKAFHSGGLATRGPSMVNSFLRVQQLTSLPKEIPNAARLAERDGTIEKIEEDPTGHIAYIGGVAHHIPNDQFGNPLFKPPPGETETEGPGGLKWGGIQVGMKVKAGQSLTDPSRTDINPHDLYRVTGNMSEVQNQMVTELHDIYGREGVRRQNVETAMRGLGDLTRVVDSGDHEHLVKGQFTSRAAVQVANKELVANGLQPVQHTPILKGIEVMPLEIQEDWMAKLNHQRLRTSLQESASLGAASNLHGTNPVSGMAYGAQFGMTQKDKYVHPELKDVPNYAY
jgi:DNA-directed RNA polymerase subunit beta'